MTVCEKGTTGKTKKSAYPITTPGGLLIDEGLSERRWLAGQALCGLLAAHSLPIEDCIQLSYSIDDTMMKEPAHV
jgi:hypothetical protein